MWPIFEIVTHFSRCDPFFQVWPIFASVTHFLNVNHFSRCDPFFSSVTHLLNVNHFSRCDPLSKCEPFLQVWTIFLGVTHFFRVWPTFSKCDSIFRSVAHFSWGKKYSWSTSCYRNRNTLRPDGPLGSYADFALPTYSPTPYCDERL